MDDLRRGALTLLFWLGLTGLAAAAPFCRVDNYGNEHCYFYTAQACQDSARSLGGQCFYQREDESSQRPASRPPSASSRSAPFCHVSSYGQESCYYYTIESCRNAAQSLGGMCIYNRN